MKDENTEINKAESPEQNRMSPRGQRKMKYLFNAIVALMVFILNKIDIQSKDIWISITNTTCVAFIYLLLVYYRYVCFPEKQKKLKALVDAFANFLALIAITITFISVVITGKASSLYADLAEDGGTSIIFGVIIGVLSSRVLFPFWDIYSKYRKV